MRIDELFADIEARDHAEHQAEVRSEAAEAWRAEMATKPLEMRLQGALGSEIECVVAGSGVRGRLVEVGAGWCALDRSARGPSHLGVIELIRPGVVVIATEAIEAVIWLRREQKPVETSTVGRTWSSLLRAASRGRTTLTWRTRSGALYWGVAADVASDYLMIRRPDGESVALTYAHVAIVEPMTGRPEAIPRQRRG